MREYLKEWIRKNEMYFINSEFADILDEETIDDKVDFFIYNYLVPTITSNVQYDFDCEIDAGKLFKGKATTDVTVPSCPCVVVSHSFDSDTTVYEFDTDEEASKAVKELYDIYLKEEIDNNSDLNEYECSYSESEDYAQITWADGDRTTFVKTFTHKYV